MQRLASQRGAQWLGGGDDQVFELVVGRGARFHRASAGNPQHSDRLHDRVRVFRDYRLDAGQSPPSGTLGVDRIGLSPHSTGPSVGPVDLNRTDLVLSQATGEAGAVAAGALYADERDPAERLH